MLTEEGLYRVKSVGSYPFQTDADRLLHEIEDAICYQGSAPGISEIYSFGDDVVRCNDPCLCTY